MFGFSNKTFELYKNIQLAGEYIKRKRLHAGDGIHFSIIPIICGCMENFSLHLVQHLAAIYADNAAHKLLFLFYLHRITKSWELLEIESSIPL